MANKVVIKTGVEARDTLIKGANLLGDAIRSTLGPYGANAYLEKGDKVTNDGKTIAQEFWHKNEIVNRGINLLRQAGTRTDEKIGDFTTTAITLAQAILKSAVKFLPTTTRVIGSLTPIEVIQKIEKEYLEIKEKLIDMATPITTEQQLIDAATVSVEDKTLGELIGKAQFSLGKDGVLIAEDSNDPVSSIKLVNGIRIDNGYSTNMIAFDPATQSLVATATKTLLTNHVIQSLVPLAPIIKSLDDQKIKCLTIIARGFSGEALKSALDYTNSGFLIYPINAPYTDQNEVMKDLVAIFGGRYVHTEGTDLGDVQISDIGYAEKIVARRWDSIMTGVDDLNSQARVKGRITELTKQLKVSESDFEKKNLQTRIAQLTSGFGIIKIGGSIAKRKYLLDKATDAANTVRLAFQNGVVPGAGQALKTISDGLDDSYILKVPLRSIYEQITSSAPKEFTVPEWVQDSVTGLTVSLKEACDVAGVFATTLIAVAQENPKPTMVQQVNSDEEESA